MGNHILFHLHLFIINQNDLQNIILSTCTIYGLRVHKSFVYCPYAPSVFDTKS